MSGSPPSHLTGANRLEPLAWTSRKMGAASDAAFTDIGRTERKCGYARPRMCETRNSAALLTMRPRERAIEIPQPPVLST